MIVVVGVLVAVCSIPESIVPASVARETSNQPSAD